MARPYCTTCGKGATHLNDETGDTRCEKHLPGPSMAIDAEAAAKARYHQIKE